MSKIRSSLNAIRRHYYERMMEFCIDRSLTTNSPKMRRIWIKRFSRYLDKLIITRETVSLITNREGA